MKASTRSRLEWLLVAPWRLALFVALALALPVLGVNESAVRGSEERLAEERRIATVAAAERAAVLVDVWILSLRQRIAGAVETPRLKAATRSKDVASLTSLLLVEFGRILPSGARERDVVRLTVVDEDGQVIYGVAPPAIPGEDLSPRDFFQKVAGRATAIGAVTAQDVHVTDMATGPSSAPSPLGPASGDSPGGSRGNAPPSPDRILLVAPIKFGLDPFVGLLIAEVDRRSVAPFLESARGDARDIYLVDRSGRLISRAGDPGDARDLGGLDLVASALGGSLGVAQGADPIDGIMGLLGTARVPETGWITLAARTPIAADAAADATLQQQRLSGGALSLILVIGSILVGVASSRSIRRRDALAESLEQQSALSGILRTITARPGELEPVLDAIAESAVRFCAAEGALIHLVDPDGLRIAALWNWSADAVTAGEAQSHPERWRGYRLPLDRGTIVGAAVLDRRTTQAPDLRATVEYPETRRFAGDLGFRAMLTSPIRRGDEVVGALSLRRVAAGRFSERDVARADAFAIHAGTAIENARLFNETKEALERQTAISEVLRAIGRSAFDLDLVLDTVLSRAATLLSADLGCIYRFDGSGYRLDAKYPADFPTATIQEIRDQHLTALIPYFQALNPAVPTAAVFLEHTTVHIPDLPTSAEFARLRAEPGLQWFADLAARIGIRSDLAVPLIKDDQFLGVLELIRRQPRPFTADEIGLIETFADQASIAIESVRLLNDIQEKSAQLQVASQHKSEFLANMSHELRTPLNAIIGFSDVLLEGMSGALGDRQREYVADIKSSGEHQLSLINDILDLSKVEAGRMELDVSEFELSPLVEAAVALIKERAARRGVSLSVEVPETEVVLQADQRKIKQVLLNLLSNAVKFTPDGGWVGVTAKVVGGVVQVSVRDTGIGIAPEDRERVFEEFRQAGASGSQRPREGTGLGLALSKRFVELHGGRLWLESELGKGSSFTLEVPLRRPAAHPVNA